MRALYVAHSGASPTLGTLPQPRTHPGTVKLRVVAAALNALDNALATGVMEPFMPHRYPLTLGRDAAGTVETVGEGVDGVTIGDEVIGHMVLAPPLQAGTLAEYAVLPEQTIVTKPATLTFEEGSALPLAGAAASSAVDAVAPEPGRTVLVVGATGGVGSFAVQLLAARGAWVIATGTPADVDRLTRLGASEVVDYTAAPVADQVRAAYPHGVDGLIDLVAFGPDQLPLTAVHRGGRVASTLNAADEQVLAPAGLSGTNVLAQPLHGVVGTLAALAASGQLVIDIEQVLPFDKAVDGLATIAAGKASGKIVVRVRD